jgi:cell wall-associated NlpC family hydrolase
VVDDTRRGRHRDAARYNPAAELSTIVKSAGQTSVKASAVLAASGGLVATFALPAQAAAPQATASGTTSAAAAPQAAPVALTLAPAVVAPDSVVPTKVEAVGVAGVKAVAKPKPRPVAVQEAVADRTSSTSSTSRSSVRPVSSASVRQSSSEVVNIARSLLGIPYVYGGESPSGFDCSGFTQYVFGKAGISLPRTASAQQSAATPVSDPKPGDLVFFGSPAWHVGIYTGNGMMIDSPREGKSTSERPIFSGVSGYGRF